MERHRRGSIKTEVEVAEILRSGDEHDGGYRNKVKGRTCG